MSFCLKCETKCLNPFFVRASARTYRGRFERVISRLRRALCIRAGCHVASRLGQPAPSWLVKERLLPRQPDASGEQGPTIDDGLRGGQQRIRPKVVLAGVDHLRQRGQSANQLAPGRVGPEDGVLERGCVSAHLLVYATKALRVRYVVADQPRCPAGGRHLTPPSAGRPKRGALGSPCFPRQPWGPFALRWNSRAACRTWRRNSRRNASPSGWKSR